MSRLGFIVATDKDGEYDVLAVCETKAKARTFADNYNRKHGKGAAYLDGATELI